MKISISQKLKIEFADLIKGSLFMIFGLDIIIMIFLDIFCKGNADKFAPLPFIIALMSIIPWYIYSFSIFIYIDSLSIDTLYFTISLFLIVTLSEALFYTFLYYKHKNIYELVSTNDKEIGLLKIYVRNILKSINRQFLCIGLIPMLFGKARPLYDIILNIDVIKKENKKR